ncbi:MAG: prohibitin family protein [Bacteroidota bacterium]|nr:prohibitin family protein [Bacteroidota bacterium]
MRVNYFFLICFSVMFLYGCAVIKPGEIGIKRKFGKLSNNAKTSGAILYNPFITKVIKTSIQTRNLELSISLPSKEGLSVVSQISILYRLDKSMVQKVINNYGLNYENIISSIFRSASADVCAQFFAKDMHSGMRSQIEQSIKEKMGSILTSQGIIIESVLMKSIQLPPGLANSIEQRLQAEQDAMRMEFLKQQAERQAEIKIIEAKGERDAQLIQSEGLTPEIIKLKSIEAFKNLSDSPNAKIIITNGSAPFLINP